MEFKGHPERSKRRTRSFRQSFLNEYPADLRIKAGRVDTGNRRRRFAGKKAGKEFENTFIDFVLRQIQDVLSDFRLFSPAALVDTSIIEREESLGEGVSEKLTVTETKEGAISQIDDISS